MTPHLGQHQDLREWLLIPDEDLKREYEWGGRSDGWQRCTVTGNAHAWSALRFCGGPTVYHRPIGDNAHLITDMGAAVQALRLRLGCVVLPPGRNRMLNRHRTAVGCRREGDALYCYAFDDEDDTEGGRSLAGGLFMVVRLVSVVLAEVKGPQGEIP